MNANLEEIEFYIPNLYIRTNLIDNKDNSSSKISIKPINEDIVTMAASAAYDISQKYRDKIKMLIVATESAFDLSKSTAVCVHNLLNLNPDCICFEVKQACYGLTAAIEIAKNFVIVNNDKKVLVIGTDVAYYDTNSDAEKTQGCGAVAMLIGNEPNIVEFSEKSISLTEDVNDFYRPINVQYPIINGTLSSRTYLSMLKTLITDYIARYDINNISLAITHVPVLKLSDIALNNIAKIFDINLSESINSLKYIAQIGNAYTASLYIALCSLLENNDDLSKKEILLYSYGSGSVAQLFSCKINTHYKKFLRIDKHQQLLNSRRELTYDEYISLKNNMELDLSKYVDVPTNSVFILTTINNGIRTYQKVLK